jgi:hypothetical protein
MFMCSQIPYTLICLRYCVLCIGIPCSDIHSRYFKGRDFAVSLLVHKQLRAGLMLSWISGIITLFFRLLSHPASRSILVSFLLPIAAAICSAVSPFCRISCNSHLIAVCLSSCSTGEYFFDASYNFMKKWKSGIHCMNIVLTPYCNTKYS